MKRIITALILLAMALSLAACAEQGDTVTYYYVRKDKDTYQYGQADAVIVGESREAAGHTGDLRYLLTLYFHGPITDSLKSPFPSGTTLDALEQDGDTLDIRLSNIVSVMEGTELTLACACLARTCFALTEAQTITISAEGLGAVSMTISRDSLLLMDDSTVPPVTESP